MGVVVDFNTRTVQGLGVDYPVKIQIADDALLDFLGDDGRVPPLAHSITTGSIDRVTGDLEAGTSVFLRGGSNEEFTTSFTLKCKSAQRLF
jgi:hypothetical protein